MIKKEDHLKIPGGSVLRYMCDRAMPVATLADPRCRELVRNADIIWAYNPERENASLVYGRERLQEIAAGAEDTMKGMVIAFRVDFSEGSRELELLCAAVQFFKGSHCYNGTAAKIDAPWRTEDYQLINVWERVV